VPTQAVHGLEVPADDAEVLAKILIKTRMAADAVGATMMDRPDANDSAIA
jgi:secreted PhoX family phosphatase